MGVKSRLHRRNVISGAETPFRQPDRKIIILKCGKCHITMTESRVTQHLKDCQPAGAKCGWCGNIFKPDEFLEHIKGCKGEAVEAPPPEKNLGII